MGEAGFLLCFLLCGYFLWAQKHWKSQGKKDKIEQQKGWYRIFTPGVVFFLTVGREKFGWKLKGERLESLKKLYVGKGEETIFYCHYTKTGCLLSALFVVCLIFLMGSGVVRQKGQLLEGYFLKRENVLGLDKTVELSASADGKEKEVSIEVPHARYTKQEITKKFQEAKSYVNRKYLGENSTADKISKPLCLVEAIPGSAIAVEWKLGADGLIQEDGSISNENLEESRQTEITVVFTYGEERESMTKQLTILPRQKTREELYWEQWKRQLEINQEKSLSEEYLPLPQQVEGKKIRYREKTVSTSAMITGLCLFGVAAIFLMREEKLRKELAKREKELRTDYPELVEQFVLLIGAGLNVKGAWERIVCDYQKQGRRERKHYVYEEMQVSVYEMESGMSEARAYELFGKRTGLLAYMKFCTLLVQNLKKGSDDLLKVLEYEVADAFRERKENAKTLGEEAGTKLLLPMMLMLVIVFVIILYAAFNNM